MATTPETPQSDEGGPGGEQQPFGDGVVFDDMVRSHELAYDPGMGKLAPEEEVRLARSIVLREVRAILRDFYRRRGAELGPQE